jgi:hypothetical protein
MAATASYMSGTLNFPAGLVVTGSITASNFLGTASLATSSSYALTSSYAVTASYALSASFATTASYGVTASYSTNALNVVGGSVTASAIQMTGPIILSTGSIVAGTAPIQLISGELLTTPVPGAMEYHDHSIYFTTYLVRRSFNLAQDILLADVTLANTGSEEPLYTFTMASNYPTVGKMFIPKLWGYYSTVNPSPTITFRLKKGSTILATATTPGKSVTNTPFRLEFTTTVRSVGESGSIISYGDIQCDNLSLSTANTAVTIIDTTTSNIMTITGQWSAADAANTLTLQQGYTDAIN